MSVKLLTEHHLEFLSLKETAQARLSLHLSKCHIVGNHMSRLNYSLSKLVFLHFSQYEQVSLISQTLFFSDRQCFCGHILKLLV